MLFAATVEIDALGAAAVGRSSDCEAVWIGCCVGVVGRGLGLPLED